MLTRALIRETAVLQMVSSQLGRIARNGSACMREAGCRGHELTTSVDAGATLAAASPGVAVDVALNFARPFCAAKVAATKRRLAKRGSVVSPPAACGSVAPAPVFVAPRMS